MFSRSSIFACVLWPTVLALCPRPLIIDTDLLSFNDDPLAIGLANVLQSWGQAEILGIASSVSAQYAPPAIDAINTYYRHPSIPLAIQKPVTNITQDLSFPTQYGDYITGLTFDFPEDVRSGSNTSDPVVLYRTLLSRAAANSVTIACIGTLDNLYHLLLSTPDSISPLSGLELIDAKVQELVLQAASYGASFNLYNHNTTYAETVLNAWPSNVKLTFVGGNIGKNSNFGARLTTNLNLEANPVAYALNRSIGYNQSHATWDATAVYYAIRGLDDVYAYNFSSGSVVADGKGTTSWNFSDVTTTQNALIFRATGIGNISFAERMEDMLLWEPGNPIPTQLAGVAPCASTNTSAMATPTILVSPTSTAHPFKGGAFNLGGPRIQARFCIVIIAMITFI